jgi:hypothetical protein
MKLYSITTDDKRFLVIADSEDAAKYMVMNESYRAVLDDDLPYFETRVLAKCPNETEARIFAESEGELDFPMSIAAWNKARQV